MKPLPPRDDVDNPISASSFVSFSFDEDRGALLDDIRVEVAEGYSLLYTCLGSGPQRNEVDELRRIEGLTHWITPRTNPFRREQPLLRADFVAEGPLRLAAPISNRGYVVVLHLLYQAENGIRSATWGVHSSANHEAVNSTDGNLAAGNKASRLGHA